MNIDSLRLFLEVAYKLSFAAVAEDRGINPSSVSRVIGQLEKHLGVRLFQRTTRTMTLTEAGSAYFRRVSNIIDELDQAEEQARNASAQPTGTLRLTASVAFGERVLVPVLPDFHRQYPEVDLELLFTDTNVDLVAEGIDLAVRLGSALTGELIATRLFSTHYRVVATPEYLAKHPLPSPEVLNSHRCVAFALPVFKTEWKFRRKSDAGNTQPVAITPGIVVSSALSLRSIVLQGHGPGLLADWLVGDDIANGILVDIFPDFDVTATEFDTAAWLLYPSRSYLPQKVRVTIDFLKSRLGNPIAGTAN